MFVLIRLKKNKYLRIGDDPLVLEAFKESPWTKAIASVEEVAYESPTLQEYKDFVNQFKKDNLKK